jgi:prophage regulatory protein
MGAADRPRRLLPIAEVCARVGLRKTAIYDRIARGEFPAPVSLGTTSRWVESEVDAWIDALIEQRDKAA